MTVEATIIIAAVSALLSAIATACVAGSRHKAVAAGKDREIELLERSLRESEDNHAKNLEMLRESNREALEHQIRALKAEMNAESEKILKAREEQLNIEARKTFKEITGSLGKDFKDMKESFEQNRQAQTSSSAAMKEHLENAVRNLENQTASIGRKADNLAEAMRGEVKGQGIWGEALFENMLVAEGFVKGRDYNREDVLRDDLGFAVRSEEGKGLRPDFVLHYPDDTDVIVDSKVSMAALNDYFAANTDEERADAARRNLESVRSQMNLLARKDYVRYKAVSTRKTLDYVLMFIPNYGAFQLAKQSDPEIWREAFSKHVLIVTEETAMPFLRMIRTAWASYEQVRSQKLIIESAQRMLDRVADFSKAHAEMGRSLDKARESWDKCDAKLRNSGQSIAVSARQVVKLGVPYNASKPLPDVLGEEENSSGQS